MDHEIRSLLTIGKIVMGTTSELNDVKTTIKYFDANDIINDVSLQLIMEGTYAFDPESVTHVVGMAEKVCSERGMGEPEIESVVAYLRNGCATLKSDHDRSLLRSKGKHGIRCEVIGKMRRAGASWPDITIAVREAENSTVTRPALINWAKQNVGGLVKDRKTGRRDLVR